MREVQSLPFSSTGVILDRVPAWLAKASGLEKLTKTSVPLHIRIIWKSSPVLVGIIITLFQWSSMWKLAGASLALSYFSEIHPRPPWDRLFWCRVNPCSLHWPDDRQCRSCVASPQPPPPLALLTPPAHPLALLLVASRTSPTTASSWQEYKDGEPPPPGKLPFNSQLKADSATGFNSSQLQICLSNMHFLASLGDR